MYFGDTKNEWIIIIFFLFIALILSFYVWRKRDSLAGIFTFSLLGNLIFYMDSGSLFFDVYHLKWIVKFTLCYWPWINLALFVLLVVNYIRNKRQK